jgi:parvulin-like peptidyl-prolyl isomerase
VLSTFRISYLTLCMILAIAITGCRGLDSSEPNAGDSQASDPADAPAPEQDAAAEGELSEDGQPGGSAPATSTENLAATVNGQAISLGDFQLQAFDAQRYHVDQGGADPNTEEGRRKLRFLRRQVLNDMIDQVLIEQAARDMDIEPSAQEVEARLAEFIEELGGEAAFEASLEQTQTTREDVLSMERASLVGRLMLDHIAAEVPETAEFVHARHIQCADAKTCADAETRLLAGEDFASVVSELSEDNMTREQGGDLDWVARGMLLSKQLEDALFALEPGERSAIVETDLGYHIIELIERDPERELPESQRMQLKERALLDWLTRRREESDIIIHIEDLAQPDAESTS